ncbi:MAG: mucoidy inhibitor MuiA family protein [Deltaproteobacteria bacterium]|nr:mucoidy inhibitor MuiA family protein [Deltaproteobacteria bacterium]
MSRQLADVAIAVRRVVVMEDRAQVSRRGGVSLPAGDTRIRCDGVAPILADKTLQVRIHGAELPRIDDTRVVRREITTRAERSPDRRELETQIEALDKHRAELADRLAALDRESGVLHSIAKLGLEELAEDVSHGRFTDAQLLSLDPIMSRGRDSMARRVELDAEIAKLDLKKRQLQALRTQASSGDVELRASVEVDVRVPVAGEYEVIIDYVVPNACWRPEYVARLVSGPPPRLELASFGCVWQRTGEDWKNVELCFSTERPSLGTKPPILTDDVLYTQKKSPPVVEVREQRVFTAGLGGDTSISDAPLGIDDGGAVVALTAKVMVDVPSDGRPHRIPIFETVSESELSLVAMPELGLAAFEKSVQTNGSPYPLLAGPVDLVRSSGLVGRSSILFVAPKERFTLGFGPDPEIRVRRDVEAIEKSGLLGQSITKTLRAKIRLSNLGDQLRELVVEERVPVSEVPGVEIHVEEAMTTGATKPDELGFLRFVVKLGPFEKRTIELGYTIKRPAELQGL